MFAILWSCRTSSNRLQTGLHGPFPTALMARDEVLRLQKRNAERCTHCNPHPTDYVIRELQHLPAEALEAIAS